ncbi:hypothetical protein ACO2Q8_08755 [Larkinella sp. VNQ87]|uniref:hypothetical protein n=1 Tax=Larkinella sp. VNQ87 TaxID=3400921 RepID=UPI003C0E87C7
MTSKELFFMNGGITAYIHRDGFGEEYRATPAEEKQWTEELIALKWHLLDTEDNLPLLQSCIDTLSYHQAPNLLQKLTARLDQASLKQRAVIAGKLWKLCHYKPSFSILHELLLTHRDRMADDIFWIFNEMIDNKPLQRFLVDCLEGSDTVLQQKAHLTLTMWAYMGQPRLREGMLLSDLNPDRQNPDLESYQRALEKVKRLFGIRN